jgi:hypothetical protein
MGYVIVGLILLVLFCLFLGWLGAPTWAIVMCLILMA